MWKKQKTIWIVNSHRIAQTVNKTIQLIQKTVKYGKKMCISNKTHKEYLLPRNKENSQKFSRSNYICKHSQTHEQPNSKPRNNPLRDNPNKRI